MYRVVCHQTCPWAYVSALSTMLSAMAHRLKSVGVDACMHSNCADDYWHKMFTSKGKALPIIDVKAHADILADLIAPSSMGL